jgi:hypothetical protein
MKLPEIYTIGVYGSSENEFFQKLTDHDIDTFCDIRLGERSEVHNTHLPIASDFKASFRIYRSNICTKQALHQRPR